MSYHQMLTNEHMSPRERVLKSLNRDVHDRIPLDIKAETGIWEKLKTHFKASHNSEVMDALGIDFRRIFPNYTGPDITLLEDGSFIDMWGAHRKSFNYGIGSYYEYAGHPLADIKNPKDLEKFTWVQPAWWDVSNIPDQIQRKNEKREYCLVFECAGMFEIAWGLRGMERFFLDMATQPEIPWEIMERLTNHFVELTRRVLEAAKGQIDIVYTWDDLGTQLGPLVSPRMWEEQIKPHHIRLNKVIKKYGARVMYHSCGSIIDFIDGFIDMGVDILNPLQPRAEGMDLQWIKTTYGKQLSFHGSMDIQQTLPFGTQEEVRAEVMERIKILGAGGGFILAPAHSIQPDTPIENIIAMYDTARKTSILL